MVRISISPVRAEEEGESEGSNYHGGLCPIPHFILCLVTKNEARKVKTKRLPALSVARQEFLIK